MQGLGWVKAGAWLRGGGLKRLWSRASALRHDGMVLRAASSPLTALIVGGLVWAYAFVVALQLFFPMPRPCAGDRPCVLVMGFDGEDIAAPQTWHVRDVMQSSAVEVKFVPRLIVRHVWDDAKTARQRLKLAADRRLAALKGDVLIAGRVFATDGMVRLTVFAPQDRGAGPEIVTVRQGFREHTGAKLSAIVLALAGPKARTALADAAKRIAALTMPSSPASRSLMFQSHGLALAAEGSIDRAIWSFREALQDRPRERVPLDWAQSALDLARVLARDGRTPRLTEAAAIYAAVIADPGLPLDWGAVRHDYGMVLLQLGKRGNDVAMLDRAAAQFDGAAQWRSRKIMPAQWAASRRAYADARAEAGLRQAGTQALAEAVEAYRASLVGPSPHDQALTTVAMADAMAQLGTRRDDARILADTAATYRRALSGLRPLERAAALNSLGNVLMSLGEREEDTARWEEAVTIYRRALSIFTRANAPLDWATAENNLGIALVRIGQREEDPRRLAEAVTAYRASLLERTRWRVPQLWATTENNLGSALKSLGDRLDDLKLLDEAVAACREALKERTRERGALQWAITQNNLGNALMSLGKRRNDAAELKAAVAAYRAALDVFGPGSGAYHDIATENLGLAEALLDRRAAAAPRRARRP